MRRTKRNFIIVLFVFLAFIALMIATIFLDSEATLPVQITLGIFVLGMIYLTAKLSRMAFKPNPLLDMLEHEPSKIKTVEVISIVYHNGRPSFQMNLHFLTEDGKRLVLSENRSSIEALLPLLKAQLPHAQFKEARQR